MTGLKLGMSAVGALLLIASIGHATPGALDGDEDVIYLKLDCGEPPANEDCFESIDAAETWTWDDTAPVHRINKPDADNRLIWEIGPGVWNEQFDCKDGEGFVTLRGAGRLHTVIAGNRLTGTQGSSIGGRVNGGCNKLEFIDLRFTGMDAGFSWLGGGSSSWSDVDIIGLKGDGQDTLSYGWYDFCLQGQSPATHYFFGSRVSLNDKESAISSAAAFWADCSQTWFYSGEVKWNIKQNGALPPTGAAVHVSGTGDFRAFGTAIRATVSKNTAFGTGELVGVNVKGNGASTAIFHLHGGIVNSSVEPDTETHQAQKPIDATGIEITGDAFAHTPGAAWVVNAPNGTTTRVAASDGTPLVPFQWQPSTEPPVDLSMDGSDRFVETDCASDGDCSGGTAAHTESHLMVYNTKCGESKCSVNEDVCVGPGYEEYECEEDPVPPGQAARTPWFDQVTGRCRGVLPPEGT